MNLIKRLRDIRHIYVPALVAAIFIGMTVMTYQLLVDAEREEVRYVTTKKIGALTEEINRGLSNRLLSFERMARRIDFQGHLDSKAWMVDAEMYHKHLPGLDTLIVLDAQNKVRISSSAVRRTAQDVESLNPKVWKDTIEEAKTSKSSIVSHLYTRYSHEPLFLVAVPLFHNGKPSGTLLLLNHLELIFMDVFEVYGYEIQVVGDGHILYSTMTQSIDYLQNWQISHRMQIGSNFWQLKIVPKPETLQQSKTFLPLAILFAGIFVALLLGTISHLAMGLRRKSRDIEAQRRFLTNVIDNLPVAVFCKDYENDFKFSVWNKKSEDLFGHSKEEVLGKSGDRLFSHHVQEIFDHKNFGEGVSFESEIPGNEEEMALLNTVKINVLGENGTFKYLIGIAEDVTERRRALRALEDSEKKFTSFMENSPSMVWMKDQDGKYTYVNNRVLEIFNSPREKIVGHTTFENVADWARVQGKAADSEVFRTKSRVNSVQEIPDASGKKHFWNIFRFPMYLSGQVYLGAIAFDITDAIEAQTALERKSSMLQTVINSSPLPIVTLDLDGIVTEWNPACEKVFGWTSAECVGRALPFVPPHKRGESRRIVENIIFNGKNGFQAQTNRMRKDGSHIELSIDARVLTSEETDHPIGIIAILTDISERKLAEKRLQEAKEQAEVAGQMKSDFLASISHEIRTPLNGIIGMTDLLLETPLQDEQRRYTEIVQSSGAILLSLINDILDISKIEAGKMTLEEMEFSLLSLVEGHASLLIAKAREKKLSLMTFVDPDLPSKFRGDPSRIGQVLVNLIGNAIKFTPHGGVSIKVLLDRRIDPTNEDVHVRFEVHDTGIGLSEEGRRRLFQPFTQADRSINRKYGGTGLGLSICKKLVEAMGGTIGLDSEEGNGSTFWFTLKLKNESLSWTPDVLHMKEAHEIRALVIDNDVIANDIVASYLKAWNIDGQILTHDADVVGEIEKSHKAGQPFDIAMLGQAPESREAFDLAAKISTELAGRFPKLILMNPFEVHFTQDILRASKFTAAINKPLKQSQLFDCLVQTLAHDQQKVRDYSSIDTVREDVIRPITEETGAVGGTGLRVLVADDVSTNQILVLKLLENLGFSGQAVANGREAVEALELSHYDIVLMDCQMPEIDGFEATKIIRKSANPRVASTTIIALTANAMSGDRQKCIEAGMNDYLSKPIRKDKLAAVLKTWTTEYRRQA